MADSTYILIEGPLPLGDYQQAFQRITAAIEGAQLAGEITSERSPITDTEEAFVAWKGGELLGFAVFYEPEWCEERGRIIWLDVLYVAKTARRAGIGSRLVWKVLGEALRRGVDRVELGTKVTNEAMQRIASRCGFEADHIVYKARNLARAGRLLDGIEHNAMPEAQL